MNQRGSQRNLERAPFVEVSMGVEPVRQLWPTLCEKCSLWFWLEKVSTDLSTELTVCRAGVTCELSDCLDLIRLPSLLFDFAAK